MKKKITFIICTLICSAFTFNTNPMDIFNTIFKLSPEKKLMIAAKKGDYKTLQELFSPNAATYLDPDSKKPQETKTPLAESISKKYFECGLYLLNQGAQVKCIDTEHAASALHWTAQNGGHEFAVELAQRILEHDKTILNSPDKYNSTALAIGIYKGYPELTRFLLDLGASLDLPKKNRPIEYYAYTFTSPEIIKSLLNKGLRVHEDDNYGKPSWHNLFKNQKYETEILETLIMHTYGRARRSDAISLDYNKATKNKSTLKTNHVVALLEKTKTDRLFLRELLGYAINHGHIKTIKAMIPYIIEDDAIALYLQKEFNLTMPCKKNINKKITKLQFIEDVKKYAITNGSEQSLYNALTYDFTPESYALKAIKNDNKKLIHVVLPLLNFDIDTILCFFDKSLKDKITTIKNKDNKCIGLKTLYEQAKNADSKMAGSEIVSFSKNFLMIHNALKKQHTINMKIATKENNKPSYKKKYWSQMYLAARFQEEKIHHITRNIVSYTSI